MTSTCRGKENIYIYIVVLEKHALLKKYGNVNHGTRGEENIYIVVFKKHVLLKK